MLAVLLLLFVQAAATFETNDGEFKDELLLPPHIERKFPDEYLCVTKPAPAELSHIVAFEPKEDESYIHHMLLYGCNQPYRNETDVHWSCINGPRCLDEPVLIYAWALQAPALDLPKDVGYVVGGASRVMHLVLSIHFKDPHPGLPTPVGVGYTLKPGLPKLYAGTLLNVGYSFEIPPQTRDYRVNLNCEINLDQELHVFAYRAHAHITGRQITGHQISGGVTTLVANRSAQEPQTFLILPEEFVVKHGDRLFTECAYDSTGRDYVTRVGARSGDEMCNLYYMFYTEEQTQSSFMCLGQDGVGDFSAVLSKPRHFLSEWTAGPLSKRDNLWRLAPLPTRQATGVELSADKSLLYVLHRGPERTWGASTFDADHHLLDATPIEEPVITVIDVGSGAITKSLAAGLMFLPEGITADAEGNIWVTDVGAHQVLKLSRDGGKAIVAIGVRLEPGHDDRHLCKPTDVIICNDGTVYVSDGYCNSRLMHYSATGQFLDKVELEQPASGVAVLPHSLAYDDKSGDIYVADRENGRVLRVRDAEASVVLEMNEDLKVFALTFHHAAGGLLALMVHSGSSSGLLVLPSDPESKTGFSKEKHSRPVAQKDTFLHSLASAVETREDGRVRFGFFSSGWTTPSGDSEIQPQLHRYSVEMRLASFSAEGGGTFNMEQEFNRKHLKKESTGQAPEGGTSRR